MSRSDLEKYIKRDIQSMRAHQAHPEVVHPIVGYTSDASYSSHNFVITWWPISQPFEMVSETHYHDFEQCLMFFGGDVHNMLDLGGEVELTLGERDGKLEKFIFTTATIVHIRAGLRHGPLNFKKINDPGKPILYNDITFTSEYVRKT